MPKQKRPLVKVIHSLFVGINVIKFRKKHFDNKLGFSLHPETEKIADSVEKTILSISNLPSSLFSPRLQDLIEKCTLASYE